MWEISKNLFHPTKLSVKWVSDWYKEFFKIKSLIGAILTCCVDRLLQYFFFFREDFIDQTTFIHLKNVLFIGERYMRQYTKINLYWIEKGKQDDVTYLALFTQSLVINFKSFLFSFCLSFKQDSINKKMTKANYYICI
jgi:hypothetical protein